MSTTTRSTVASAHARIDALEAKIDLVLAAVAPEQPASTRKAKPARKPAKKTTTRKPAAPKRTAQPKADLGRKGWNRALTALARSKGSQGGTSVYSLVLAQWEGMQEAREQGMTPAEALALLG